MVPDALEFEGLERRGLRSPVSHGACQPAFGQDLFLAGHATNVFVGPCLFAKTDRTFVRDWALLLPRTMATELPTGLFVFAPSQHDSLSLDVAVVFGQSGV